MNQLVLLHLRGWGGLPTAARVCLLNAPSLGSGVAFFVPAELLFVIQAFFWRFSGLRLGGATKR